ncbi:Txe/YoeB family addiction module toxin [Streptomyces sp. NRRL WC-3549]|uniref:Txe/YoeB family addiction module toxin n=1 Tax=Streptomyces sp. NRRL WC-3549 TaxID=1463925 RepID=UPI0004C92F97|nr:Txe/YoeB family addiction module toxin [Streptomyces sp. NRRL WC-3549]
MKTSFSDDAWEDYTHWADTDRKTLRRVNDLIKEITRTPFEGRGKPEPLKGNLSGWWFRRITQEHRLVYRVTDSDGLEIIQARDHY